MTPKEFIRKWSVAAIHLNEEQAAQFHFKDLCTLLGQKAPYEDDPTGATYRFEKAVKVIGKKDKGYADVWKKDHFAVEYKRKGRNLTDAYTQLLLYRDDLGNPPILMVSDLVHFEIHTNFTGTNKQVHRFTIEQLEDPHYLDILRKIFTDPDSLNPKHFRESITQEASRKVGEVALRLQQKDFEPRAVAHFLMQLVFAMFAEDSDLLPRDIVKKILETSLKHPHLATRYLTELFQAMAEGGNVLLHDIAYFNGGLYEGSAALPLDPTEIQMLYEAASLSWSDVEPAIFGTLFERSLDPEKRSQLGAHYTSREDINRVIMPVIIEPLRQEWAVIRAEATNYLATPHDNPAQHTRQLNQKVRGPIATFLQKLQSIKVLDPACGSGNFLYVAMQALKDLEKDVLNFSYEVGAGGLPLIGPKQFYGIEVNLFAHEIASVVVWIGYLQWNRVNGFSNAQTPVLQKLNNIQLHDALMDENGSEFEWPKVDFIVGNPPFLGDKHMKRKLTPEYVQKLRALFKKRIPGKSDFVCYWFEKARAEIEAGHTQRAGLISTNSIRDGDNRAVLQRIKSTGNIFMAWSNEEWVLDGAAVRVSIVGFDGGIETTKVLDGEIVPEINADLTALVDVTKAKPLKENQNMAFVGIAPSGPFDVPGDTARSWLKSSNVTSHSNTDVLKPYLIGSDLTQRPSDTWLIDFHGLTKDEAANYLLPFDYVEKTVFPVRQENNDKKLKRDWWLAMRSRPEMRKALAGLSHYICTPRVATHRIWVYVPAPTLCDSRILVIARDDLFTFGVLHSSIHEVWSLAQCSWHGAGDDPTYNAISCFQTFPFPQAEAAAKADVEKWAQFLLKIRQDLLQANPILTLTTLYNQVQELKKIPNPAHPYHSLVLAHSRLDGAVAKAYGWNWPLEEQDLLQRLMDLNVARSR